VLVNIVQKPKVDAGADRSVCAGDPVNLNAGGASQYSWNEGVIQNTLFYPTITKTYTVTGKDIFGCSNTDEIVIKVNPLPKVHAGADLTITKGERVTLTASGASSYTWDYGVEQGIAFLPEADQTYTVLGKDINGCSATDEVHVTVKDALPPKLNELDAKNFDPAYFNAINIVFVLDVSNSMAAYNKIDLLKSSMESLLDIIRPEDRITLVTYSSNATVLMASKTGNEVESMKETVAALKAMGHTAGNEGIKLGFKEAKKSFIKNGTNLVVVITDGAFDRSPGNYLKEIEKYQKLNINFVVVGIKNAPQDEANMREAAEAGKGSFIPIVKPVDTQLKLIMEIKKQAFKESGGQK
jgi:Mg-chelatase subunit ChlD